MSREVAEWIGKTDDSMPPERVRLRILRRYNFTCYKTGVPIAPGSKWQLDHIIAIINGGKNCESNLAPISFAAHKAKTKADVAEKAKTDAMAKAAFNIRTEPARKIQGRPFPHKPLPSPKLPVHARTVDAFGRRL